MVILAQAGAWEMYGPLGLIVATLLSAMGFLYRDKVTRERELDLKHLKEREDWRKEHREERSEILTIHAKAWEESRADLKESHGQLSKVIGELTAAVQTVHVDMRAARIAHEDRSTERPKT